MSKEEADAKLQRMEAEALNTGQDINVARGNNFLRVRVLKSKLGYTWAGVPCSRERALEILSS